VNDHLAENQEDGHLVEDHPVAVHLVEDHLVEDLLVDDHLVEDHLMEDLLVEDHPGNDHLMGHFLIGHPVTMNLFLTGHHIMVPRPQPSTSVLVLNAFTLH